MNQPTPSYSFDVTSTDFDRLVVQASFDQPVLVDFWAQWCPYCRRIQFIRRRQTF